jgi:transposase
MRACGGDIKKVGSSSGLIPTSPKKGAIETLYTSPPASSVVICIDEMGPLSARSHPGQELVSPNPAEGKSAGRAKQEVDYGRTQREGYVFGALQPASGEVVTATYTSRSIKNFIDFLDQVEVWIPSSIERIYVVLDNLATHKAYDVLLFNLAHPRWEFVFQPKYAAYLNLIEPWWKTLKSLALKGKRFETWEEVEPSVARASAYWNKHKHPFVWGKRRRHRLPRKPGIVCLPKATSI